MLSAGEVAGLIVAMFWAILVCFLAFVLVKLARLLTATTKAVNELSEKVPSLLDEMSYTVSETNRQLVAVESVTANMKEVSADVAKITGLASSVVTGPIIKISSLAHGLRAAVSRRERRAIGRKRS